MSIKINHANGSVENFTIVLSTRNHKHLGEIINVSNVKYTANLNAANELYFTLTKYVDKKKERLWDKVIDFRFVWVKELNEYFEITVQIVENDKSQKNITCKSACECELSQKMLYNIEINSEADISRANYVPTKFYNSSNHKASLLHRILEIVPSYSIISVDSSLSDIQRTFSVNDKSVYDFLINDCANEFHCIFLFDSVNRGIYVKDLYTVCLDCNNRGDFTDTCPKCGSTKLKYFGEDTTILVSTQNLTDKVQLEVNADNVKNVFKLEAGDDIMNSAIMSYIPNGTDRIYNISKEQEKDMPVELVKKISSYNALYNSYIEKYQNIIAQIYQCIEQEVYLTSKQMPDITIEDTTASTEAAKLTYDKMNPIALSSLSENTSLTTVNSALINYAKVFVSSGTVKVEVDSGSSFSYGQKIDSVNYGIWSGRFKVTRYANKDDIAYSDWMTLQVNDNYETFLSEKILKNISSNNTEDNSVYDVLTISNIDQFNEALKLYCLNRLKSFRGALNNVLNILQEAGIGEEDADLYSSFYEKYWNQLQSCDSEICNRTASIESWKEMEESLQEAKVEIQTTLNFKDYLGEELYKDFVNYTREGKYSNPNYISDGLTDDEIFSNAQEFIKTAKKELISSSCYQHSIRSNMYNLLLMNTFKPILDKFELGNWIRIQIDEEIYRLRLISYEIDFDNLNNLNTEFSDVTITSSGVNDICSILKQASSVNSTYSYYAEQASQGQAAKNELNNFVEKGLKSSLINIKNNNNEEVTFDNTGILVRSYDDILNDYNPEQARITQNILCYTNNNWKTTSLALGKHDYYKYVDGILGKYNDFGLSAKFVTAGYINGSQFIGGEIYSLNYSPTTGSYMNLINGTFTIAGGKMKYDGNVLSFSDVALQWQDINDIPANLAYKGDIPNDEYITNITKNTITTEYVNALKITADSVAAENITGEIIEGKRFIGDNIGINSYEKDGWAFYAGRKLSDGKNEPVEPYKGQYVFNIGHGGEMYCENITVNRLQMRDRCAKGNAYLDFVYTYGDNVPIHTGTIYQDRSAFRINSNYNIEINSTSSTSDEGKNVSIYGNKIILGGTVNANYTIAHKQSADFYSNSVLHGALFSTINSMSIESRNNADLILSSASGIIKYSGTLEENSSKRYKTNISCISDDYVNNILKLSAKKYNYKKTDKESFGFIAEEVIDILPEIVGLDSENNPDSIAYIKLIPLIIQKIQDINNRLQELE